MHRCVVSTVVVWLHILGPYWCLYVALFGVSGGAEQQQQQQQQQIVVK